VSRGLRSRSQKVRGCLRGRVVVQPATQVPVCSRVDVSGISQVPRRSVPCLCLVPGPRPNRRCLASLRFRQCCPRSLHSEGFSVMEISGLPRGFSTRCLGFTSGVATTHARLASGGRARLYRKGVEPSGSLRKVSDHSFSSSGFILAQEGPPSSLVQLRNAVWTGVTRDTRPNVVLNGCSPCRNRGCQCDRQQTQPFGASAPHIIRSPDRHVRGRSRGLSPRL
jgi:hypothetical protein